jgi:hypothetical protein
MNNKQTSQISLFYPLSLFGSHPNPLKHFLNLFCFNRCPLPSYFSRWTTFVNLFFCHALHHVIRLKFVKYCNRYMRRTNLYVKNPPLTDYNENVVCHNLSLGLATKAKGGARLQAKREPGSHSACSRECKRVRGSEPSHSQGSSTLGVGVPVDSRIFRRRFQGSKIHG